MTPVVGFAWWLVAGLYAVTLVCRVSFRVRGRARTLSFTPTVVALGLFLADPRQLVLGVAVATAVVLLVHHRRPLGHVAGAALVAAGSSVTGVWVIDALAPTGSSGHALPAVGAPGVESLLLGAAAVAAVAAATAFETVAALLAAPARRAGPAVLSPNAGPVRRVGRRLAVDVVAAAVAAVPGVVAVLVLDAAEVALPFAASGAAVLLGHRAFAALGQRHAALERLHQLSDALTDAAASADVVRSVLVRSLDLMQAGYGEIVLQGLPGRGARAWVARLDTAGEDDDGRGADEDGVRVHEPQDVERLTDNARPFPPLVPRHLRWSHSLVGRPDQARRYDQVLRDHELLGARGIEEALVVPLRIGETVAGHLLVADRHGAPHRFSDVDVRLLVTVANHAGVALTNAQLIERLHVEARRDELTGLANRTYFHEVLDATTDGSDAFAIMMIDFDGFKAINDTLGHSAGDELLRELAHRLDAAGGDDATVARLGGDEFAVLATACHDEESAVALSQRLLAVFDEPVDVSGTRLRLGGSLGIALSPQHATSASDLMRHADVAMYAAKAGAGGARVFSPDLVEAEDVLTLGGDLRDAVERDEIQVVVHPLMMIGGSDAGRVHSVEVLARWRHPERGEVPPATFFRTAELAGITVELSARILDRALRLCRQWLDDGMRMRVAVNAAPRWLADTSLPDQVASALDRHGVPADLLCLELTERGVIADPRRATPTLQRLYELGVHLAVDDFGTGFSSLTYLSRMPVDQLKIDEIFVSRVGDSDRDRAIVRSIVDLGHNLGLEVVAEGVSDPAVRAELEAMGCRLAQGYLFARPFPPAQLAQFLADRAHLADGGAPGGALPRQRGGTVGSTAP